MPHSIVDTVELGISCSNPVSCATKLWPDRIVQFSFNPLSHGGYGLDFKCVNFQWAVVIDQRSISSAPLGEWRWTLSQQWAVRETDAPQICECILSWATRKLVWASGILYRTYKGHLFSSKCCKNFVSHTVTTLVYVMSWCCQAPSHYLNQCWPKPIMPCGFTRPQWVNRVQFNTILHKAWQLQMSDILLTLIRYPVSRCNEVYFDGLVQDCSISTANALEILQSCTKTSILWLWKSCNNKTLA